MMKEVERLVKLGVVIKQPNSEWGSPTFIIPKKNKIVRFLSDFREVNRISAKVGEMIGAQSGVKIVSYIFFDVHGQSTA